MLSDLFYLINKSSVKMVWWWRTNTVLRSVVAAEQGCCGQMLYCVTVGLLRRVKY